MTMVEIIVAIAIFSAVVAMSAILYDRINTQAVGVLNRTAAERQVDLLRNRLKIYFEERLPDNDVFLGNRTDASGNIIPYSYRPIAFGVTELDSDTVPQWHSPIRPSVCDSCRSFSINRLQRKDPASAPSRSAVIIRTRCVAVPGGWSPNLAPPISGYCGTPCDFSTHRLVVTIHDTEKGTTRSIPSGELNLRSGIYSAGVCLYPNQINSLHDPTAPANEQTYNLEIIGFYSNHIKRAAMVVRSLQINRPVASPKIIFN